MKPNKHFTFFVFVVLTATFSLFSADYYIDSDFGDDENSGLAPEKAWKSLDKVNGTSFKAGDSINFRRDRIWFGQLSPKGSGAKDAPIVIRDFGDGHRAIIDGNGLEGEAVVYLHNQEYWEIHDLEITNLAEEEGD